MFQFSFEDYSLAVLIRNLTQQVIQPYADQSKAFSSDQLRLLLAEAFQWGEFDFMAIINILEFGKEKYKKITLDQLTDYVMEKYLGEITIVKYMKQRGYARRDENIMNKQEFLETLALGLNFLPALRINQSKDFFEAVFESLDTRKVGTISHAQYSLFLKNYLGSESPMAVNPTKRVTELSESRELSYQGPQKQSQGKGDSQKQMIAKESSSQSNNLSQSNREIPQKKGQNKGFKSALDEFHDLIVTSVIQKCRLYDNDRDERLFKNECQSFLYDVLELERNSIGFIIQNYFNFHTVNAVSFGTMIQIVCEIHFRQILTNIIKNEYQNENPSKILMQKNYFTQKLMENCYFFPTPPTLGLLQRVFDQLLQRSSNNSSGKIALDDFRSFVLVHCCNNKFISRQQAKKSTHTLANPPASIMQAENSHYEEDQSQGSSIRPSRKQFVSTHKSISKEGDSKERSVEEIGLSSNKRTKTNKLSEESLYFQNELQPSTYPLSSREVNASSSSIKLASEAEHTQNLYGKKPKPLKEILWNQIQAILVRYALTQKGRISKQQSDAMFNSEDTFNEDKSVFINRTSKMFAKRVSVQMEMFANYIIHLKGEQALIKFSGKQIKGKSTLNQSEISSILYNAYGKIMRTTTAFFDEFSKNLFAQNGKSLFQYKNYLELIARNLSIKNNF